ncbi:UvrD-helicase domain-containing protein [Embleya sp. NBC_00888]|uniref:UvrD-helicase domain-containing protein n=1 Tax=Embleya sp. NBC_00888 TaxID=2975960 RepID=UPI0038636991|nr:UvrD-helicase domain-containing protein [Embleya sp. NBC_00888]
MSTATAARTCTRGLPGGPCGSDVGVRRYQHGVLCAEHAPAYNLETTPMQLTAEQAEIVETFGDGVDLVAQAGAGCGKTSTLKAVARSDTRTRFQAIAYNKSAAADMARAFPPNAVCKTAHSLAFDPKYMPRLKAPRQSAHQTARDLRVEQVLGFERSAPPEVDGDMGTKLPFTAKRITRLALDTVTAWCHSADPEITAAHVPTVVNLTKPDAREQLAALVLPVAAVIWDDLGRETGAVRLDHDHYLKMWALGGPRIQADVVMLDEAQDTNSVLYDVIRRQDHAQRIMVGDSAQQIYEWRGARDALGQFARAGAVELTLSQSFRFGEAVAEEANRWLYLVGGPLRLRGHDATESTVGEVLDPDAILCRSNAGAMGVVLDAVGSGRRTALVGGGGDLQRLAWAARDLQAGRPTDHPELCGFGSWAELREYAEEDGGSLRVLVDLVAAHGPDRILAAVDQLVEEDRAELVVSTAHKSKGREWDAVRIHADFRPPKPDVATGMVVLRREEARLAYVAVTRARRRLDCTALAWRDTVTAVSD